MLATVPPAERTPREKMLKIGYSYYTALVSANGQAAPFADDCLRHENGMQTTGNPPPKTPGMGTMGAMGCRDQINTHTFDYITRIEPRRVEIADPETGLVFGLSQFRQPMEQKFVKNRGRAGRTEGGLGHQAVRSARRPHFQDPGRQDSRDRGDGVCDAIQLEDGMGVRESEVRIYWWLFS